MLNAYAREFVKVRDEQIAFLTHGMRFSAERGFPRNVVFRGTCFLWKYECLCR